MHHELTDAVPFASDIALPRGTRHPAGFEHASWHRCDGATFDIGREFIDAAIETRVAVYSPERTIVDTFRLMYQVGRGSPGGTPA